MMMRDRQDGKKNARRVNYQKILEDTLLALREEDRVPKLLLHSCCAPCSSYVLEYLSPHFEIIDYYYNPNITDRAEFEKREAELARLIREMPHAHPITFLPGEYEPDLFFHRTRGMEEIPEGGERCFACYEMRLSEAARKAAELGCDYFTTTLSISPLKNAQKLNEIGGRLAEQTGVPYLFSDFKKKNGYQRSIELSHEYDLYRQNYCGCVYSRREAEKRDAAKSRGRLAGASEKR